MSNPNTERIVVKDKDIDETRLSFEEQSDPDSDEVLEYDAHPALRKEIWGWYAYSWAVSIHRNFTVAFMLFMCLN
jgi:hypothetical protein